VKDYRAAGELPLTKEEPSQIKPKGRKEHIGQEYSQGIDGTESLTNGYIVRGHLAIIITNAL